jgi:hypothetical protein
MVVVADFRNGSNSEVSPPARHVGSTPRSRHRQVTRSGPFGAVCESCTAANRASSPFTPIREVPFAVNVSVSPINVAAHGVLNGDKGLSQNPQSAMLVHEGLRG